jgi:hypothetical protein
MTSLREYPVRRQPPRRPTWLLPAVIVGIVALAVAIVIVVVRLLGGTDDAASSVEATPEPSCSTTTAVPRDDLPIPGNVRVNVYNATEVSGLASKTARELKKRGFDIREVANDPVGMPIEGIARIRYGPSAQARAELLAYYVPGAELVELDRKGPKVDLALGALFDGIAPQTEVDAALDAPEAVVSGPGCLPTPDATAIDETTPNATTADVTAPAESPAAE